MWSAGQWTAGGVRDARGKPVRRKPSRFYVPFSSHPVRLAQFREGATLSATSFDVIPPATRASRHRWNGLKMRRAKALSCHAATPCVTTPPVGDLRSLPRSPARKRDHLSNASSLSAARVAGRRFSRFLNLGKGWPFFENGRKLWCPGRSEIGGGSCGRATRVINSATQTHQHCPTV
jgi:hypothetical protein